MPGYGYEKIKLGGKTLNYWDIAVVVILLIFIFSGRRKGFVLTSLSFLPTIGGLFITNRIYPSVSKFIRNTFFFEKFKNGVSETLGFMDFKEAVPKNVSDVQLIESLKLPDFLKEGLIENNNPVVKNIFGAFDISDYIVSYVANVCVNVFSMIIVFVIVVFLIKAVIKTLDIISKLPVLNFLNKSLGGVLGFIKGLLVIWISGLILIFCYANPSFLKVFEVLYQSKLALFLYENNILLFMIMRILA